MFAITPAEWVLLVVWIAGVVAAAYATRGNVSLVRRLVLLAAAAFLPVVGSLAAFVAVLLRSRRDRSTRLENEAG